MAKGSFDGPRQAFTIGANDQLTSSQDTDRVIVAYRNGGPVRLSDVADVIDGVENTQAGGVDEPDAGGGPEHSAAARRQHHHRRRSASRS